MPELKSKIIIFLIFNSCKNDTNISKFVILWSCSFGLRNIENRSGSPVKFNIMEESNPIQKMREKILDNNEKKEDDLPTCSLGGGNCGS